jgi:hypothetical protein
MPSLPPEVSTIIRELSAPLEPSARPAFERTVTEKLEAMPTAGVGTAHRICRSAQLDYRDNPSPDLRAGRIGPRG